MAVEREVEIEASPEEVWEAVSTEEGRQGWLEDDRDVLVESVEAPSRLVWWWNEGEDEPFTRVELEIEETESGSRVLVRESIPDFPLTTLATAFAPLAA